MKLFKLFESKELATELLWFRRFISENDLETEIEVEGDKLVVYQDGKKFNTWDAVEAKRIRTEVLTNSIHARMYARTGRFELGEPIIATEASDSYLYAKNSIKKRFELGEPTINKDAFNSVWYATEVIRGPYKPGEAIIATSASSSYSYANLVLKGRFKLGEPVIATNQNIVLKYKEFLNAMKIDSTPFEKLLTPAMLKFMKANID